jgi:hypothetical protein
MGWRHVAGIWLLVAGAPLVWCANGSEDDGGDAAIGTGTDPDASVTEGGTDGGSSVDTGPTSMVDSGAPDTATTTDSGGGPVDSAVTDSGTGVDSQVVDSSVLDTGIPDVVIPDVSVPPGTTTCNYLGSASDFAQYVAECLVLQSIAGPCSAGCAAGSCCGAICQNSNNQAVCLPK